MTIRKATLDKTPFGVLLRGLVRVPKAEYDKEEQKYQAARKRRAAAKKSKRRLG